MKLMKSVISNQRRKTNVGVETAPPTWQQHAWPEPGKVAGIQIPTKMQNDSELDDGMPFEGVLMDREPNEAQAAPEPAPQAAPEEKEEHVEKPDDDRQAGLLSIYFRDMS